MLEFFFNVLFHFKHLPYILRKSFYIIMNLPHFFTHFIGVGKKAVISKQESFSITLSRSYIVSTLGFFWNFCTFCCKWLICSRLMKIRHSFDYQFDFSWRFGKNSIFKLKLYCFMVPVTEKNLYNSSSVCSERSY